MIICTDRKIVVYFNPKTGGTSVYKTFKSAGVNPAILEKSYYKYSNLNLHSNLPNEDFSTYKHFVFYRNPIERAYSAYIYFKRTCHVKMLRKFSPHLMPTYRSDLKEVERKRISQQRYHNDYRMSDYFLMNPIIIDALESVKIKDIIESKDFFPAPTGYYSDFAVFEPQINWLDYNLDITYLNYADFDNELRRLLGFFGLNSVEPVINRKHIFLETDPPFDAQDLEYLNTLYKPDFDFFAAKGLTV